MSLEAKIAVWGGRRLVRYAKDRAAEAHAESLESDFLQFLAEIEALNLGSEQIEQRLTEADAEVDELLRSYFLLMLGSRGKKAKAATARVTAHYFANQRPSDRFFRRFGRLLEQCEDPVLDCISDLIGYLCKHSDGTWVAVLLHADRNGSKLISLETQDKASKSEPYEWDTDYYESIWLLKQFGFVKELPSGLGPPAGPLSMQVRAEAWPELEKICTFLQPGTNR